MVAIMMLSVAIIPMVGMFDMGLRSAVLGGHYDQARALANAKLEDAMTLPYHRPSPAVDSFLEKYKPINEPSAPSGLGAGTSVSCSQPPYTCAVTSRYMQEDLSGPPASPVRTSWLEVRVEVTWDGGSKSYTTTGIRVR